MSAELLRRAAEKLRSPLLCNWDRETALALADWLEPHAKDLARVCDDVTWVDSPGDTQHALAVARAILREEGPGSTSPEPGPVAGCPYCMDDGGKACRIHPKTVGEPGPTKDGTNGEVA